MADPASKEEAQAPSTSAQEGQKRPASSADLTEPADKKSWMIKTPTTSEPDSVRSAPGGIMNMIANRFSSPFPVADAYFVIVNTANMNGWFSSLRNAMLEAIYPDSRYEETNVITDENVRLMCRHLTKARVDHVYASYSSR